MATVTNERYLFKEYVVGFPEDGKSFALDTTESINLNTVALNGGFLLKIIVLSVDPYFRGKMSKPTGKHYTSAFVPDEPLYGTGVAIVLRSEDPAFEPSDHVYGATQFSTYQIVKDTKGWRKLENKENLPWSVYTGVVGLSGKTAYMAWKEYAFPQKGEVAFITSGAGPVGSFVIQQAKLDGLKVIASAGSDDKVKFLKKIGVDVAFNYKTQKTVEVLQKEGPINIYWDNVGGETLENALDASAVGARFIECGMISDYNATTPYHVKNLFHVVGRQIKMTGFLLDSLVPKYEEKFYKEVPGLVAEKKILYTEDITIGLANAGKAIVDVQTGKNTGKSVISLHDK